MTTPQYRELIILVELHEEQLSNPDSPSGFDCSCDETFLLGRAADAVANARGPVGDPIWNDGSFQRRLGRLFNDAQLVGHKTISEEEAKKRWHKIFTPEGGI